MTDGWSQFVATQTLGKQRIYSRKRRAFLKANPVCAVCKTSGTDTVHHRRGRKGDLYLDDTNFLAVHKACDKWIHSHPREAAERGLLVIRHRKL